MERKDARHFQACGEFSGESTPAKTFVDAIGIGIAERKATQYCQAVGA